jgi:hypothetical protein
VCVDDGWLIDETRSLSEGDAWDLAEHSLGFEEVESQPPISIVLRNVTIHDTKAWFNRPTEVRLDALVVTAASAEEIYYPATLKFPGVRDKASLPIDEHGVAVYDGRPHYFIDVSLIASQGGDDKTLGELLADNADALAGVLGDVSKLAVAVPQAAAITGAAAAASKLSAAALRLLSELTGKSIGLYRVTWFENRDRFGLGYHPNDGERFRKGDFEFQYEIFQDVPQRVGLERGRAHASASALSAHGPACRC